MESLEMNDDPKSMWENLRKMAKDMGIELPEQDPMWNSRPEALNNWHITVLRQNGPR